MISPVFVVRDILLASAAVTAVVAQRVYLLAQPQNAVGPNIIVRVVSGTRDTGLNVVEGQARHRIAVESRSNLVGEANALASAVFNTLNGYSAAGVDRIIFANDAFVVDDATKLARRILEFYVYPIE
jgi:Protein of unknown function (DUF3168)